MSARIGSHPPCHHFLSKSLKRVCRVAEKTFARHSINEHNPIRNRKSDGPKNGKMFDGKPFYWLISCLRNESNEISVERTARKAGKQEENEQPQHAKKGKMSIFKIK